MIAKNILVIVSLVFIFPPVFGQGLQHKIDSLEQLHASKVLQERLHLFYLSSVHYQEEDHNLSLAYSFLSHRTARQLNDSLMITKSGRIMARGLRMSGALDSAIAVYETILPITRTKGYQEEQLLILNAYAVALTFNAQYDMALNHHFESIKIATAVNDTLSIITSLHNIGLVYYKLKDYAKALQYYEDCDELKQRVKDHFDEDMLMLNIGLCHAYLSNYEEAENYIEKGLLVCSPNCTIQRKMAADFAKGIVSFGLKEFETAEKFFSESYQLAKGVNDIRFQLDNIDYLSEIYITQKNVGSAVFYLNKAEELMRRNRALNLERIKIYSRFSELYLSVADFEKALTYQLRYAQLKDSVFDQEMTNNLMKLEVAFAERENNAMIAAQNELIALKSEIISRQRIVNIIAAVLCLIFIGFLILLFLNYKQQNNINFLLAEKISERTRELEMTRGRSSVVFQEREVAIQQKWAGIRDSMRKIIGICFLGMREIPDPIAQSYFQRIESISQELDRCAHEFSTLYKYEGL